MSTNTAEPPLLPPTLDQETWNHRILALHKQLYASEASGFDEVMTHIYHPPEGQVLADHCLVHDGTDWHLFYVTGPIANADEWIAALRAGDFKRARQIPYEVGDGHAAGPTLRDLAYRGLILEEPQGEFGIALQGTSNIIRFEDHWVNIYTSRGPQGQSLCLARSHDLTHWTLEAANPIWQPPAYASPTGACKNAHIIRHPSDGRYLIYYCLTHQEGTACIALLSTPDFQHFDDHGPVLKMTAQLRGTAGIESPCVVVRDGMWHLFFGFGAGCWHAVSRSPHDFMGAQHFRVASTGGCYCLGPYHVVEVFAHQGCWWMTSSRKEYQRYLNRKAGVLKFRGSAADEATLLEGLYLSALEWEGDQPLLRKPEPGETP
jgi:hypothetical protein